MSTRLMGIAIDKGDIQSVDQPISAFLANKTLAPMDARKGSLTLENLLRLSESWGR